jgi:hypothetical protein
MREMKIQNDYLKKFKSLNLNLTKNTSPKHDRFSHFLKDLFYQITFDFRDYLIFAHGFYGM